MSGGSKLLCFNQPFSPKIQGEGKLLLLVVINYMLQKPGTFLKAIVMGGF